MGDEQDEKEASVTLSRSIILHPVSYPFPMIITCPRCEESGDPDSSLYESEPRIDALAVGTRFIRETIEDTFYCTVCEAKGIYCEAEIQEE